MCKTCKQGAGAKAPAEIPNKFQALIDSPSTRPYDPEERAIKTVHISEEQFISKILPAVQAAATEHVESRIESIRRKIDRTV